MLGSEKNGTSSGDGWRTEDFVKTTKGNTSIEFKFKTNSKTQYLNVGPLLYGHTGAGNLKMKAKVHSMSLIKNSVQGVEYISKKNGLVRNGNFEGNIVADRTGWMGGNNNAGWYSFIEKNGNTASIKNNALEFSINGGYIETRNSGRDYFKITEDSIKVEPNTHYILTYDYSTEYISGDSNHGFAVIMLGSEKNGTSSGDGWRTEDFVKTTKGNTSIEFKFKTNSKTQYINVGPLLYGHTGAGNLSMKATVKNLSLIKNPVQGVAYISKKNGLLRNGLFEGNVEAKQTGWMGGNHNAGWNTYISKSGNSAKLNNGSLELDINGGYVEVKSAGPQYFGVTEDSIKVDPNTKYILEYDYETQHGGGNADHGFTVLLLGAESHKKDSFSKKTLDYVKTSKKGHVKYEVTTTANTHYVNIIPAIYGHKLNGQDGGTLKMKAILRDMSFTKSAIQSVRIDTKNGLIRNGAFEGDVVAKSTGWIGGNNDLGWFTFIGKSGNTVSIKNNTLTLEIDGGYVETRNAGKDYFAITPDSIKVEPNTKYELEYDYDTQHLGGDADHGFTIALLGSKENGTRSWGWQSQDFTKTSTSGHKKGSFTTKEDTHYLNIAPILYGHKGAGTLKMKASIKNLKLVKSANQSVRIDEKNGLVRNGNFKGTGKVNRGGWAGGNDNLGWSAFLSKMENRVEVKNGALEMEVDGGYVEARNTTGGYFGVTEDSIKIEPNATYIFEYDYDLQKLGGDSGHGFTVALLMSESHNKGVKDLKAQPYTRETKKGHITYRFTTPSNAHYLNISPIIYGHTGAGNLKMKAFVKNMSLVKEDIRIEEKNGLLRNGKFDGNGTITRTSWIGGNSNLGWFAFLSNNKGKVELKDNALTLEVDGGYIEARNTNGGYFGVTDDSIKVKPNTQYVVEFDYETKKLGGNSPHGFTVGILGAEKHGVRSMDKKALNYVNVSRGKTHVSYEFTTSSNTHYINISPIIYAHTGNGTLKMKARVWDVKVVEDTYSQKYDNESNETKFEYFSMESKNNVGFAQFKIKGETKEVGVKYLNSQGEEVFEILELHPKGLYYFLLDKDYSLDTKSAYSSFIPYFIDSAGETIYYNTTNYIAFENNTGVAIAGETCRYGGINYNLPQNAYCVTDKPGHAWICEEGYIEHGDTCVKKTSSSQCQYYGDKYIEKLYTIPRNSQCVPEDKENVWMCDEGYYEKGSSCLKKAEKEGKVLSLIEKGDLISIEDVLDYNKEDTTTEMMELAEDFFGHYKTLTITIISEEVNRKYEDNAPMIFAIINEEQSHLLPPVIEDDIFHGSVGLGQIRTKVPKGDKEYFGYKEYTEKELLHNSTHLKIMNDRINIIKAKLEEEGKRVTPENIGRTWNGGPSCVKQGRTCSQHAIDYGVRIQLYYPLYKEYNEILTREKHRKLKEEHGNYLG